MAALLAVLAAGVLSASAQVQKELYIRTVSLEVTLPSQRCNRISDAAVPLATSAA